MSLCGEHDQSDGNAEDGTSQTYTVHGVTRTEAAADPLLAEYDTNGTPGIQIDEVVQAVGDYAAGDISIEELVHLVQLYATGG